jgi:hypothetical protein
MTESTWGGARPVTRPDDKRLEGQGGKKEGAGRKRKGIRLELGQKVLVHRGHDVIEGMVTFVDGGNLGVFCEATHEAIRIEIA